MTWRNTLAISILLFLFAAGCESESSPGPASGEAEVVIYTSADQPYAEKVLAAFQRETGIEVQARFDTEASKTVGLAERLRAEKADPKADVFWSSEVFHTIRLAREGIFRPYVPEDFPEWPDELTGKDNLWRGFAYRARVIAYNTDRVAAEEAPRTLEDCLDPKWKGRIVMADPAFGTTGGDVASWFAHYGPERARDILAGLAANEVRLVSGNATAVRAVAEGQAHVCFTDTDDVYAGQRNDWPIAMHPLDQDGAGTLVIPNTVALVAGGPNPEIAERLARFLLSPQVERILAETPSHNTPVHKAVADDFPQYAIPNRLKVDYAEVADYLPEAIRSARETLR